jgi:hypothetical protein
VKCPKYLFFKYCREVQFLEYVASADKIFEKKFGNSVFSSIKNHIEN